MHLSRFCLAEQFWKKRLFVILSFLATGSIAAAQDHASFIVNGRKTSVDSLNKQVEYMMTDIGIPAFSLAIIDKGKLVFYHNYGVLEQGKLPVKQADDSTIFEACSLSKSFIVYTAYQMVKKGLLDLDKPLYQYLEYEPLKHDERYKLITARMVLSHSSGLENHLENNNREVLEIVEQPGTAFEYSGEGYIYLSKVIEKLTHMSTEQYLQQLVYTPLKLTRTYTTATGGAKLDHATGHDAFGKPIYKDGNTIPDIAGRIHTNAHDYALMMLALFGQQKSNEKVLKEISKPVIEIHELVDTWYGPGYEVFYGTQGDTILIQGGDNNGFKGMACYSITHKCGFVFFANADRAEKIGSKLCEVAIGINMDKNFDNLYANRYPSAANTLLRVYKEKGPEEMRHKFDNLLNDGNPDDFRVNDMVELVYYLKNKEYDTAKYIAQQYMKLYPESAGGFVFQRWLKN